MSLSLVYSALQSEDIYTHLYVVAKPPKYEVLGFKFEDREF